MCIIIVFQVEELERNFTTHINGLFMSTCATLVSPLLFQELFIDPGFSVQISFPPEDGASNERVSYFLLSLQVC